MRVLHSNFVRQTAKTVCPTCCLLLATALAVIAAQTGNSGAAEVHDRLHKAEEYLKANDSNSAAKELNAVLALDPRNAEAYADLGVISFARRDYGNASQYLSHALAIDPSLAKTQALLGICERRLGKPSARSLLEKSFPELKEKNLRVDAGLELANIYYQEGDLDRCASVMRTLVDLAPENVEVLYMAQRVYYELADGTTNKLAIVAPGSARMQQVIAERLINEGDLKGATEHYRKALEMNPRLPGVHYELAEAILESAPNDARSQSEAEKELETAVALEGESAGTDCLFARIAVRRSDLDGAYAHYRRAFALDSGNAEAQLGLGRLLAKKKKPEEAAKYLHMAVESDPLNEEAHYWLASVSKTLQLREESEKEFRLFEEIKEAKDRLRKLYRQMNIKPPGQQNEVIEDAP